MVSLVFDPRPHISLNIRGKGFVSNLSFWSPKIIISSLKTEDNLEVVKAVPLNRILLETGKEKHTSLRDL